MHKVVFHVDWDDPETFNLALANIANLFKAVPPDRCRVALLVNGPAVQLLTAERIRPFAEVLEPLLAKGVDLQVCRNALARFEVDPGTLHPGCRVIPAGIPALIELQDDGFAYIKP